MLYKAIRMKFEPLRELAFGSISGAYAGVGTALDHPARLVFIENLTDQNMYFSFNAVDDHIKLPPNSFFLPDATTNEIYLAQGERLYVKQASAPATTGSVCFTVVYGTDGNPAGS